MVKANAKKRVRDPSWDFRAQNTKFSTHGLHTYPAMMIPQIARRLIETYGKNAKTILDPFVGSGTVLVESKVNNKINHVIGVDLNPLALLISKSKSTPVKPSILLKTHTYLLESVAKDLTLLKKGKLNVEVPNFTNIDFWFKPDVKVALAILKKRILEIEEDPIKGFFLTVFSETVRKVSNTRGGEFKLYRIPEDKLREHNPQVFEVFRKKARENISAMEEFYSRAKDCNITLLGADSRNLNSISSKSVDLVVTSPPYGDSQTTVAYGQFSRLALQWLGLENDVIKNLDKESLGGRPTRDFEFDLGSSSLIEVIDQIRVKDEKRAREVLSFYIDFNSCVKEIDRVMKPNGFLCFVVGNRTVKEIQIPTDLIITELFQKRGYRHNTTIVRSIPSKRMPKKNSPTNEKGKLVSTMNEEYIIVLQK